jgi:putative ATPase
MESARNDHDAYGVGTILFLDEIHRFSKAQQDALLPGVENGWVTLIAATTENPSFSVISPLLSRSLLLTLDSLSEPDLAELLTRATSDPRGLAGKFTLSDELAAKIAHLASGDGRRALTILDAAAQVVEGPKAMAPFEITEAAVESAIDRALVRYDKDGDQHYDIISAFIKSVRGSDADAAIHYLARMIEGGEDPRFIARRLMILAAEDIGLADPQALPLAVAAAESVAMIGMPEGRIPLAEATIYLALAPKSNSAYLAINAALDDVRGGNSGPIPKHLRSSSYPGAAKLGNGKGYQYPHDDARAVLAQQYLDGEVALAEYYQPKEIGAERELAERWPKLRAIIRSIKR